MAVEITTVAGYDKVCGVHNFTAAAGVVIELKVNGVVELTHTVATGKTFDGMILLDGSEA